MTGLPDLYVCAVLGISQASKQLASRFTGPAVPQFQASCSVTSLSDCPSSACPACLGGHNKPGGAAWLRGRPVLAFARNAVARRKVRSLLCQIHVPASLCKKGLQLWLVQAKLPGLGQRRGAAVCTRGHAAADSLKQQPAAWAAASRCCLEQREVGLFTEVHGKPFRHLQRRRCA